jgi:catechol 2,3-dioxygenase-like lactoylglutathione lyase family enzyme
LENDAMRIQSIYPVIAARDPAASKAFYAPLLDLDVIYEADFYVSLASRDRRSQLAFVHAGHESIPAAYRQPPQGCLVTVEVENVDDLHRRAQARGEEMALELRDEPWGQRHFMVRDPDGLLVDVVQVIPPSPEHAAFYAPES